MKFKFTITIENELNLTPNLYGREEMTAEEIIYEELNMFKDDPSNLIESSCYDNAKLKIEEVK